MSVESQAPGWEWYFVAMYFFVGGVSAGAFFIGSLIELFGDKSHRDITKVAYYIAFPLILITPILLIADLGRPERFWHLFFYTNGGIPSFNFSSPLSVGSWALLVFGIFAGLAFVDNLIADGVDKRFYRIPGTKGLATLFGATYNRVPRKLYAVVGSIAGFFVAGYTGVLLNLTARPLWAAADPLLGALFIASAASSGAAAIYLVMALRNSLSKFKLDEFENLDRVAMILELVLIVAVIVLAGEFAAPLMNGMFAVMFWGGAVILGILIPLALNFFVRRQSSGMVMLMALLVLLGGALLRISLVTAGQA